MKVPPNWTLTLCLLGFTCACEEPQQLKSRNEPPALPVTTKNKPAAALEAPTPLEGSAPSAPPQEDKQVANPQSCNRLPFFDFYRNARLITLDEPDQVRLQIHINYHTGAGCMAPDGFGTDLILTLRLRAEGSGCFVDEAKVRAVDWGQHPYLETDEPADRRLRFDSLPFDVLEQVNLKSPEVANFTLYNEAQAVSVLIRQKGVLFYEKTKRDSVLHTVVDSQGEETGCCWPATSTYYREHGVYD